MVFVHVIELTTISFPESMGHLVSKWLLGETLEILKKK